MSNTEVQRGKRTIVKTKAIATHDDTIKKSASVREVIARNKKVREEMEALDQAEENEKEAEAEEAAAAAAVFKKKAAAGARAKADPQPTKKSTSSASGSKSKPSSQKDKVVLQEETNLAEVLDDEARWNQLIQLVHVRDFVPVDKLKTLDLDELEVIWGAGEGSKPTLEKAPAKKASPAKKAPAKPNAKASTKTPAKVKSALPKESRITWLGSPLEALKNAKVQSERLDMPSPLAQSRKRNPPGEPSGVAKRPRTEATVQSSKTGTLKPHTLATKSIARNEKLVTSSHSVSRSGSLTAPEGSAQARFPSHDIFDSDLVTSEVIDIDRALDGVSDEERASEYVKPTKTKRSFDKKGRPRTGEYHGVERQILDQAVLETVLILTQRGMIPNPAEYELYVEEGWDNAVQRRRQELKSWPMSKDHATCIKQRINSWRGRSHTQISQGIASAYNLAPSAKNTPEDIMAHATDIAAVKFHRDPNSTGLGNYSAPFLAESIHLMFFVGVLPVGIHFKQEFNSISLPVIAYVAGLIETYIKCYQRRGVFDKPERLSLPDIAGDVEKHYRNLLKMQKSSMTVCEDTQEELAATAMSFSSKAPRRREPKKVPGVLSDGDFDVEELTPEQLAERRRARRGSLALSKLPLTANLSSDSEMEIDDPEAGRPSTPSDDKSGGNDNFSVDDEGTETLASNEVVQTARSKNGCDFVPLDDDDDTMAEVPAGEEGADEEVDGEGGNLDNKRGEEGESEREREREEDEEGSKEGDMEEGDGEDDEEVDGDKPVGAGVGDHTQEDHSDLTELSEGEGKLVSAPTRTTPQRVWREGQGSRSHLGNDPDEQPPAAPTALSQDEESGVGDPADLSEGARIARAETRRAEAARRAAERRMAAAIGELVKAREAKEKEKEEKAARDKATAKAAVKVTTTKSQKKGAGKGKAGKKVETIVVAEGEGNEQAEEVSGPGKTSRHGKRSAA